MSKILINLSSEQKIDMALSILGWSKDTFNQENLEEKIFENIKKKFVSISKDNNVAMNYSEQWAYGVLLMFHE